MARSTPFEVVAIITPKPDKIDRVLELLNDLAHAVKTKEHGCTKYHLHRQFDVESGKQGNELIMIETYKDKAAWDTHRNSDDFKTLGEISQKEGLFEKGLDIKLVEPIAGFGSR